MNIQEEIDEIIRTGAHNDNCYSPTQTLTMVKHMVEQKCEEVGISSHLGYEGVERPEDLILYLNSLMVKL